MKAALAASRKGLIAVAPDDFDAGRSDEEPSRSGGDDSGGDDGGELGAAASSSGEEEDADAGSEGWSDDDLEAGPAAVVNAGEGAEEGSDGPAGTGSGSDSEGEGGQQRQQPDEAGFLEGGKSASFAKAFSMILEGSGKVAAKAAAEATAGGAVAPAPILAASKSIAKRKAEEAEEQHADREAKRLRQEMKKRGHVVPRKRGEDPAADQQEKSLARLATKGVVRLFNAIAKAQKQLREAEEASGSRTQAVKLGKASFLAQLKRSSGVAADGRPDQALVPSAPARQQGTAGAAAAPASGKQQQQLRAAAAAAQSSSEDEDAGGWEVLKQGFVGLQGGNKMKDWDKQASDDDAEADGSMGGSSDDDE